MISTLVEKTVLAFNGADFSTNSITGYVPEVPIAEFLDEQIANGLVDSYSFVAPPIDKLFDDGRRRDNYPVQVSDVSQFNWYALEVHGVPENFLSVTDPTYYYPNALQKDVPVSKTDNGYLDVV